MAAGVVSSAIWSLLQLMWRGQLIPWRLVVWRVVLWWRPVRVSVSALTSICENGVYLLVEGEYRPGEFGPVGGVCKYYPSSSKLVSEVGFTPEARQPEASGLPDIRGQVRAARLIAFWRWLHTPGVREVPELVAAREASEELADHGLLSPSASGLASPLQFRVVRCVWEGPYRAGNMVSQLRVHFICEPVPESSRTAEVLRQAMQLAASKPSAALVDTKALVETGRTSKGAPIGWQSRYVAGCKPARPTTALPAASSSR